ncbi:MAG: hypothetical protein JWN86_3247 [Planctomycetota bacterium]|nr:hypothetical protein [Planctomycetota bacterium]
MNRDSRLRLGATAGYYAPRSAIEMRPILRKVTTKFGKPTRLGKLMMHGMLRQVGTRRPYFPALSELCQNACPAFVSVSAINHSTRPMAAFEIRSAGGLAFHFS